MSAVKRYQHQQFVDALHYPENPTIRDNAKLHRWINDNGGRTEVVYRDGKTWIVIKDEPSDRVVTPGDYIVRCSDGKFVPVHADIFEKVWKEVPGDAGYAPEMEMREKVRKFRIADTVLEAMQVLPGSEAAVADWVNGTPGKYHETYSGNAFPDMGGVCIPTDEGRDHTYVQWGWWVVRTPDGDVMRRSDSVITSMYTEVSET